MAEYAGHTAKNGAIGAFLTLTMSTAPYPWLGFLAPLVGGFTSGYLHERGTSGGARVGIVMALFSGIPVLALGGLAKVLGPISFLNGTILGSIFGTLNAAPVLVVLGFWLLWTILALILGVIGGIIGGTAAS